PDAIRAAGLLDKDPGEVIRLQPGESSNLALGLVYIDFRLQELFLHEWDILLPVGRGDKAVGLQVAAQPDLHDRLDVAGLKFPDQVPHLLCGSASAAIG